MVDSNVGIAVPPTPAIQIHNRKAGTSGGGLDIVDQYVVPLGQVVDVAWDYFSMTYNVDGTINVVTYKTGGSGGTTVLTLTLGYTSGVLSSLTKT